MHELIIDGVCTKCLISAMNYLTIDLPQFFSSHCKHVQFGFPRSRESGTKIVFVFEHSGLIFDWTDAQPYATYKACWGPLNPQIIEFDDNQNILLFIRIELQLVTGTVWIFVRCLERLDSIFLRYFELLRALVWYGTN